MDYKSHFWLACSKPTNLKTHQIYEWHKSLGINSHVKCIVCLQVNYINEPKLFGCFSHHETMFTLGKVFWPRFSNRTTGFRHLTFDLSDHPPEGCGPEHFLREKNLLLNQGMSLTDQMSPFISFSFTENVDYPHQLLKWESKYYVRAWHHCFIGKNHTDGIRSREQDKKSVARLQQFCQGQKVDTDKNPSYKLEDALFYALGWRVMHSQRNTQHLFRSSGLQTHFGRMSRE